MKRLIINADDFGLTAGVSEGIIFAMKEGIVTSTTVMMNMPAAKKGIRKALKEGITKMGVHLTLTCGKPVVGKNKILSLVDKEGSFYKKIAMLPFPPNFKELEIELRAQIEKFLGTGMKLTHFDSHHHIQRYSNLKVLVGMLAKEYDVPLRHTNENEKKYFTSMGLETPAFFSEDFYGSNISSESFKRIINSFPDGTIEIITHPGFIDEEIKKTSTYSKERLQESKILTSTEIKTWVLENNIRLIDYEGLSILSEAR